MRLIKSINKQKVTYQLYYDDSVSKDMLLIECDINQLFNYWIENLDAEESELTFALKEMIRSNHNEAYFGTCQALLYTTGDFFSPIMFN